MFYDTKILDAYGKLKKIVSSEELQRRHWENFKFLEENCNSFANRLRKGNSRNGLKKTKPSLANDETY